MKYQALSDYLEETSHSELVMCFSDIEKILGFKLPTSARKYRPWWSNGGRSSGHSQSAAWSDVGWSTSDVQIDQELVTFKRLGKAEERKGRKTVASQIIEQMVLEPDGVTISDLSRALSRSPGHIQQEIARLRTKGDVMEISAEGRAKVYGLDTRQGSDSGTATPVIGSLTPADFQSMANRVLSEYFDQDLFETNHSLVPKRFDFVSKDESIVGDAKYYTMVRGEHLPPAKFATIAEHVWLLEKTEAKHKFLVFGNDRRVPERWLGRFRKLNRSVSFFYLSDKGSLELLQN